VTLRVNAQQPLSLSSYSAQNSVAAQPSINLTNSPVNLHKLIFRPVGTVTTCTVALDSSADGVTWSAGGAIVGTTCTSAGEATSASPFEANFVRVNVTAFSGSGNVNILYIGSSTIIVSSIAGGGTGGNTPVLGATADSATIVGGPVYIGVNNTGTVSGLQSTGSIADGNPGARTLAVGSMFYNGTNWDRSFYCNITTFQANVVATTTQLVAGVAGKKIRICTIVIERNDVTGVATTVKLVEGTGTNCGTGQTSLTGSLFSSGTTAVTTDSPPVFITGPFITNAVADALCIQTTGAASSFDMTISYEQH
jgi:hypothetical protein